MYANTHTEDLSNTHTEDLSTINLMTAPNVTISNLSNLHQRNHAENKNERQNMYIYIKLDRKKLKSRH